MNQELDNQTPLFRFVSLRSAELTKEKNKEKRFVLYPEQNANGHFENAVVNKSASITKMQALKTASASYTPIASKEALREICEVEFCDVADWITRNKSNINVELLIQKVNALDVSLKPDDVILWDNLFYQVITLSDFYVKEELIQYLVLNNLLVWKDDTNFKSFIPDLVNAKVILPSRIFEESMSTTTATNPSPQRVRSLIQQKIETAKIQKIRDIVDMKISLMNAYSLMNMMGDIIEDYNDQANSNYSSAVKEYQIQKSRAIIVPNIPIEDDDTPTAPTTPTTTPTTTPVVDDEIEIAIDFPLPPGVDLLEEKLSSTDLAILNGLIVVPTSGKLSKVITLLNDYIIKTTNLLISNTTQSNGVTVVGNTAIPVGSTNIGEPFTYQLGANILVGDKAAMFLILQLPNSGYVVKDISYEINSDVSGKYELISCNNVIILYDLFKNSIPYSNSTFEVSGVITFTNGEQYEFNASSFSFSRLYLGDMILLNDGSSNNENGNIVASQDSFIPQTYGYRQLGIADYRKVVSKIDSYKVGEVAHIENVMARELREKVTTSFRQSQVTETTSSETESEEMSDTTSTQRFEMQSEISKLLQEQKQFSAHLDVNAKWSVVSVDAGASYASNISKEQSNRQAVNQSKELTQRAMERIVSRTKTEKTVKQTNEFTEENKHRFDNTQSAEHVSGVYRYINAVYKNQIYNYGKRLMYEFMVPQPAKLHNFLMLADASNQNVVTLVKPEDPRLSLCKSSKDINRENFQSIASAYGASVNTPPAEIQLITKTFSGTKAATAETGPNETFFETIEIEIPDGYKAVQGSLKYFARYDGDSVNKHATSISFANHLLYAAEKLYDLKETDLTGYNVTYSLVNDNDSVIKDKISVGYSILNYLSFSLNLVIATKLIPEQFKKWQEDAFNTIVEAYENQLAIYEQKLATSKAEGDRLLESNPLFYRNIEQSILRTNCISYMIDNNPASNKTFGKQMYEGSTSNTYKITLDSNMDEYSSFVKFMEQAFEWDMMSYSFYPYYWGNRSEWKTLYQAECNDEIFRNFLQAGMARVVVTVRPGFEDAVMYYLAFGKIWNGGQMPVLGNPLYLSIVDELREQEYSVDETWNTVLPTNLVALQKSGVAIDASGLPNNLTESTQNVPRLISNKAGLRNGAVIDAEVVDKVEKIENRMIENVDIVDGYVKLTTKDQPRQVIAQISVEALKRAINESNQ